MVPRRGGTRHLVSAILPLVSLVSLGLWAAAPGVAQQDPLPIPQPAPPPQADLYQSGPEQEGSYGYVRVADGTVTVIQSGNGERIRAAANEPLLVGDEVWVAGRALAELVLPDRNLVRLAGNTELLLEALALSPDRRDPATTLTLRRGGMQVVVVDDFPGDESPAIRLPNATIFLREPGSYLVFAIDESRSEVVVRDGRAQIATDRETADVRSGEEFVIEGRYGSDLRYARARGLHPLEQWGRDLAFGGGGPSYVDESLRYGAASLDRYGAWIQVGGRRAWRPYVSAGWRPYHHGRWRYSPTGLIWSSYEPWGWVPYHYGTWDYVGGYGWCWYPGTFFRPAHVYWYWGPRYAGWIPYGYYNHHYGRHYGRSYGFHFGLYGSIGGSFGPFQFWVFSPLGRVGHHHQYRYTRTGHYLARGGGRLGRGILTTDTRHFRPNVWRRPAELQRIATSDARTVRSLDRLPDANPFVRREERLPAQLERVVTAGDRRSMGRAVDRPGTDGRGTQSLDRIQVRGRDPADLSGGRRTVDSRSAPATRRPDALDRPTVQRRPEVRRTPERPTQERRALPQTRRPDALDRPTVQRRPETRRTPERPTQERRALPQTRRPEARDRPSAERRPEVRRTPERPTQERRALPQTRRPEARDRPSAERRPEVRRTPERPTQERRTAPQTRRPEARDRPSAERRPDVRRSNPSVRRPSPSARRPSPSAGRSSPSVRRSSPSVRISSPCVRRSSPSVRRGGSRSGGARRRSGGN